jgi:hypothetical protein
MLSHWPSRRVLSVMCTALLSPSAAHSQELPPQQQYDASFSPLEGDAQTIFTAPFTAPLKSNGYGSWYSLEAYGPPGCADAVSNSGLVMKGEATTLYLQRRDIFLPAVSRAWCPGAYIANLIWHGRGGTKFVLIGNFTFHVRGKSAPATAPQAKYGVRLTPRVGGPHTTFVARLVAPFDADPSAGDGHATSYQIDTFGPPGCAESGDGQFRTRRKGQVVTLRLSPGDIYVPHEGVRSWCAGSYIALVYYNGHRDSVRLLGDFRFRVRAPAPQQSAQAA